MHRHSRLFLQPAAQRGDAGMWNLASRDAEAIVWPVAPMLASITMRVVRRQWRSWALRSTQPVTPADVAGFAKAGTHWNIDPARPIGAAIFIATVE